MKSLVMAFESIWHNKMRALLTMLGIIIGVAAVIILVSVMSGITNMVTETFEDIGTNTITVSVTARGTTRKITPEQMTELRDTYPKYFDGFSPSVTMGGTVKNGTNNITCSMTGVNEEYDEIKRLNVTDGRFLNYVDVENMLSVCVVGTYIREELFEGQNPVGQTLKINGYRYEVVGVLEEKGDSSATSSDNVIYIPYTNARALMRTDTVSSYTFTVTDDSYSETAVAIIESFAESILGDSDYVSVTSMQEIMESFNSIMDSLTLFLVLIAGVSLLVGGIGIMNIMLVSVSERTREIGIRKSLGAKDWAILSQFVIEAGTISSIGGIIGIVIGSTIAVFIGNLMDLNVTVNTTAAAVSFGVSFAIGVFFGFLPARKAANLNPIDALRYD